MLTQHRRDGSIGLKALRRVLLADIDHARASVLPALRTGGRRVVFDLTQTQAIDENALDALKKLTYEILHIEGASVGFEHVSESIEHILKAARFDHVFRISRGIDAVQRTTPEAPV